MTANHLTRMAAGPTRFAALLMAPALISCAEPQRVPMATTRGPSPVAISLPHQELQDFSNCASRNTFALANKGRPRTYIEAWYRDFLYFDRCDPKTIASYTTQASFNRAINNLTEWRVVFPNCNQELTRLQVRFQYDFYILTDYQRVSTKLCNVDERLRTNRRMRSSVERDAENLLRELGQ